MREKKKAQFMELDILLALLILVAGFIMIKQLYIHPYDNDHLQAAAKDAVAALHAQKVGTLDQAYLQGLQAALEATGKDVKVVPRESIAWQLTAILISAEHPENHPQLRAEMLSLASGLAREAMGGIGNRYHYNISVMSGDRRYALASTNEPVKRSAAQARTLLTGLQIDKNVFGYTASAFLSSAQTTQRAYTYLGGFVGQGNITTALDIPVNAIDITGFYLEGDFRDNFTIDINGQRCASIYPPSDAGPFTAITTSPMDSCAPMLRTGNNDIAIRFTGDDLNKQYVGGGYLAATYTAITRYTPPVTTVRHQLPGIEGVFNLYDAITIPGDLESMRARLHYHSNHSENNNTVFFGIANALLHQDNESMEEQDITITNAQIRTGLQNQGLSYEDLSNKTVPIRMGYKNISLELISGNLIDTVLITDLSGSMNTGLGGTTRISLARQVDKEFVQNIHESNQNNRIGLVAYGFEAIHIDELTNDNNTLIGSINGYLADPNWYTCTACGIRAAIDLIRDANPQHYRSIVVMSDGAANWCYDDENYCASPHPSHPTACDCNDNQAVQQAIDLAREAWEDHGIEVYAIAFTSSGSSNMREIARVMEDHDPDWEETFYAVGDSVDEIIQVYNQIAQRIISLGQYQAQVVSLSTNNESTLYPDSYIEYTYTPTSVPEHYGELIITGEKENLCTTGELYFPSVIKPLGGTIISYSGSHWTDKVVVNGEELFMLEDYGSNYQAFGDPFVIGLPYGLLHPGPNTFTITTADDPDSSTGCSPFNKLLYTATINSTYDLTSVYPEAEGCRWEVDTPTNTLTIPIPTDYDGTNICLYDGTNTNYDEEDVWQALAYRFLQSFDLDDDSRLEIDFEEHALTFNLDRQQDIPYLWGPALLEVTLWQ